MSVLSLRGWLICCALPCLVFPGCGSSPDGLILANVGGERITAAEFRGFSQRIPQGMKQGNSQLEVDRNLLESLIDKTLLRLEAQRTRVEEDTWFKERRDRARDTWILELYHQRQVNDRIVISEDEIRQRYHATGRDRALRFSGIMVKTRQEALQLLERLRHGADFQQLAVQHSLHQETGERGGDVGGYKRKDQVDPFLAEHLFRLQEGDLSEPIPQRFAGAPHYAVFKIMDEMPVALETAEPMVREELLALKRAARMEALADSLERVYAPRLRHDAIGFLLRFTQTATDEPGDLPESEGALPICTYAGGLITLDDLLGEGRTLHLNWHELADSARVVEILQRLIIPKHLFLREAHALGLHQDPDLLGRLANKREELLLEALRQREVDQQITVSEEEARAFYETHPEKFTPPETLVISEVLVASEAQAHEVRETLETGADVEALAAALTIRPGSASHGGRIRLNLYTRSLFPELYDLAKQHTIGEIGGPIRIREGYSVFQLLEHEQKPRSFDRESRRRAIAYVKVDKAYRGYVRYVRGLREKYPVEIFEQNLAKLSRSAEGTGTAADATGSDRSHGS